MEMIKDVQAKKNQAVLVQILVIQFSSARWINEDLSVVLCDY